MWQEAGDWDGPASRRRVLKMEGAVRGETTRDRQRGGGGRPGTATNGMDIQALLLTQELDVGAEVHISKWDDGADVCVCVCVCVCVSGEAGLTNSCFLLNSQRTELAIYQRDRKPSIWIPRSGNTHTHTRTHTLSLLINIPSVNVCVATSR